jgi:hypothetical protein
MDSEGGGHATESAAAIFSSIVLWAKGCHHRRRSDQIWFELRESRVDAQHQNVITRTR